jgi:hypothetical protein
MPPRPEGLNQSLGQLASERRHAFLPHFVPLNENMRAASKATKKYALARDGQINKG